MNFQKIDIQLVDNDNSFSLTETECKAIENEKKHYENSRAASIGALKIVQKQHGWVSDSAIQAISDILGIPASDVEGVATFYSQIYRMPIGRHLIRYCDSVVCYIMGYKCIQATLEKNLNIKSGHSTPDGRFTLLPTCCLGNCDKGPTMMINEKTYIHLTPKFIVDLLEQCE
ncbi:NADH-quinone oxidoreductase subunit NuoE [Candidatus Pantoea carbekii]|uniref:NADH-quinone oxidoreductase subunit E n=1 Tax=Candidatus Pantoea carbekii TaxID=1235990 RepID=U3U6D6_9GAMM|nr:NADH-quinone oxidoreductase subunit NuoE [Candidatus Pantoea carbekii]AKC31993.1 NADH dehydrogenase I subunit E [Candidatus Pantoea carbekii]BAO00515.1 NADH dehydrogenase I chain E [Candidatus Pantoea carbekii]